MDASGNQVITTKSWFPNYLLKKGPLCETDVSTYIFCHHGKSAEQYEKIFKQLNSNECGQECGYQFVMCREEVDESGEAKVLGMVQFKKEPFVIDEITQYENVLKRLLDASRGIPFFQKIEDCNVNHLHEWLEWFRTEQRLFKHGVFVPSRYIDDGCEQDVDSSSEQSDDSSSEQELTTGCAGCSNCSTLGCSGNSLEYIFCI